MSVPTGNFIYGLSPIKRENPKDGQSEWYYLDPRNASTFSDFKKIDVPSQNTPNPYAKEIQNYIFNTNPETYKILYGNEQAPQENQQQPQPEQKENITAKPIFSNQQNNQIFSQPQNATGPAKVVNNNFSQSHTSQPLTGDQIMYEIINTPKPQSNKSVQGINYIEKIKDILEKGSKLFEREKPAYVSRPISTERKTYILDDFGRPVSEDSLRRLEKYIDKGEDNNNEITTGLTYENYYKILEHLRGLKNDKGNYVGGIEGYAGYPYLDIVGKNTVCTGNLIDENNTSKYPYTNIDTGEPATPKEIKQGYENNKVYQNDQKSLKTAHPAKFFEDKTNLRLTEEQCNELDKDAIIKR